MSTPTAAKITQTLSHFDGLVWQGLEDGNIHMVMKEHGLMMVSSEKWIYWMLLQKTFYKWCTPLTGPESAAFCGKFYVHKFLKHFCHSRTTPTFVSNARNQLAKFNKHSHIGMKVPVAPKTTTTAGIAPTPTLLPTNVTTTALSLAAAMSAMNIDWPMGAKHQVAAAHPDHVLNSKVPAAILTVQPQWSNVWTPSLFFSSLHVFTMLLLTLFHFLLTCVYLTFVSCFTCVHLEAYTFLLHI